MSKPIITKICPSCKNTKNINEFYKNRRSKDRHQRLCKICITNVNKNYSQTKAGIASMRRRKKRYRQTEKCKITEQKYNKHNGYDIDHHLDIIPLCGDCHRKVHYLN